MADLHPETCMALDILSNPIMIAHSDMTVKFVNKAALALFSDLESAIQQDLPHFRVDNVIGQSIDQFHKTPSKQRALIDGMTEPHKAGFVLGGQTLHFTATPRHDAEGNLQCVFVEWVDMTATLHAQKQVETLISGVAGMAKAQADGNFGARVDSASLDQTYAKVADSVNHMIGHHIAIKDTIISTMKALAAGDTNVAIPDLQGDGAQIAEAIAQARQSLVDVSQEISRLTEAMTNGNLAIDVNAATHQGVYQSIISEFAKAFDGLNAKVSNLNTQVEQMTGGITDVTETAQDLNRISSQQSENVERIAASVEETDAMVQANAEATRGSSGLVRDAMSIVTGGKDKVTQMVTAMEDIQKSSGDISRIIKAIDDIAFQTNLLALNAAVEAARAGQHGRGFAVVAQEVRNLAGRSAKAAQETSDLIADSTKRVSHGAELAADTETSFVTIAETIAKIEAETQRIEQSSQEQSRGTSQISTALGELTSTTLQNTQQAETMAQSAQTMQDAMRQVQAVLNQFTLRESSGELDLNNLSPEMAAQIQAYLAANA
ncbi:methyl-accepting chemotaxis protein [Donghicola eburneus]|uniref:Putative cytoplasmic chemoreceptor, TlpT n=1 Tax=Donghicola eburneus TaxID=393278 RepID=A0A1M4MYW9_9RHOB|nr:methyl-accepting chemotaxis protein [Donghicola eburneus]SCM66954.1 putative cytoplasmic chemoreceptor, TlpT [Donghicola eburneus]SFQ62048.1 methyl-accepting chemotaxis protein [Donghicola eburneus]